MKSTVQYVIEEDQFKVYEETWRSYHSMSDFDWWSWKLKLWLWVLDLFYKYIEDDDSTVVPGEVHVQDYLYTGFLECVCWPVPTAKSDKVIRERGFGSTKCKLLQSCEPA